MTETPFPFPSPIPACQTGISQGERVLALILWPMLNILAARRPSGDRTADILSTCNEAIRDTLCDGADDEQARAVHEIFNSITETN